MVSMNRGTLKAVTTDPCLKTPALPHDGGLQHQVETAAEGTASKEALQVVGNDQSMDKSRNHDCQLNSYASASPFTWLK